MWPNLALKNTVVIAKAVTLDFWYSQNEKNPKKGALMAGAEGLEPSTVGFGDRCSTIRTMPLWNCRSIINKLPLFVKGLL